MRATHWSLVATILLGACAVQEDASTAACGVGSVSCNVAGSTAMAGAGGGVPGEAGAAGSATAGTGQAGSGQAGAAQAGSAQGGTGQAGAAQGGAAPQAGAAQGGTAQAGAAQAGAPQAGAPQAGSGAGGAPATGTVVIQTNRDKAGARFYLKVVAPGNYLQWVATTVADAEKFEQISVGTDLVKLRATSINKYVALDQAIPANQTAQADYLIANAADAASAATLNIALCATTNAATSLCAPNCRGIQVMSDDDANKFVVSDDQFTLTTGARARSNSCGTTAGAWESWQFIPQ